MTFFNAPNRILYLECPLSEVVNVLHNVTFGILGQVILFIIIERFLSSEVINVFALWESYFLMLRTLSFIWSFL